MENSMKILMPDIETSPNEVWTWGLWDQNVALNQIKKPGYILCWAARWYGQKKMLFSSVWKHKSKKKMLTEVYELFNEADAVVHYNGIAFDTKWLNSEWAKLGLTPPSPFKQIDLFRVVKANFKLPSYKLEFVLRYFGLGKKYKHDGFPMWIGCMEGDKHYQKEMEKYNKIDVSEMEKLYVFLLPWIMNHPNYALYVDDSRPMCTNCGSLHVTKQGTRTTKAITRVYPRFQCQECGHWMKGRTCEKKTPPQLVQGPM